jgi:ankyrin repeat protein
MLGVLIPILFVAGVLVARGARSATDFDALYAAASDADPGPMRAAIARLTDVDARDPCGYTPLGLMATYGRLDAVEMLVARGAAVDGAHPFLGTPLMSALRNGHLAIARALLERGAQVDVQYGGLDPLACAVLGNSPACVSLVLAAGADPLATGRRFNLLTIAVQVNEVQVMRGLLVAGVDPNVPDADGTTPLSHAVEAGAREAARLLLAAGADASHSGAHGRTPRDVARQRGDRAMLEILAPVEK